MGTLLLERMRALQEKHSIIGDVRGQGLMLGVEMVKDRASKEPATAETGQVCSSILTYEPVLGFGTFSIDAQAC